MADPKNPSIVAKDLSAFFAGVNAGAAETVATVAGYADKATKLAGHPTHLADGLEKEVYDSLQHHDEGLNHLRPYDAKTATTGEKNFQKVGTLAAPTAAFAVSAAGMILAAPEAAVVAGVGGTAEVAETATAGVRAVSLVKDTYQATNIAIKGDTLVRRTVQVGKGLINAL